MLTSKHIHYIYTLSGQAELHVSPISQPNCSHFMLMSNMLIYMLNRHVAQAIAVVAFPVADGPRC